MHGKGGLMYRERDGEPGEVGSDNIGLVQTPSARTEDECANFKCNQGASCVCVGS